MSYLNQCDLPDYESNTREAFRVLRPGGRFVIANLHPMRSADGRWQRDAQGEKEHVIVDRYFDESDRHWKIMDVENTNFHRFLETYVNGFLGAGFSLESIREPSVTTEALDKHPGLADELRVPNFIIYSLRKPMVRVGYERLSFLEVLLVIDMQQALTLGDVKQDLVGVVDRVNRLAQRIRGRGGSVIFVQHDGPPGDDFAPDTPGWQLLEALEWNQSNIRIRKQYNDAFFGTDLQSVLTDLAPSQVFITGWATDLCVDATIRSAAAMGYRTAVVADAHTVSHRPDLNTEQVKAYHHWKWQHILSAHPVTILNEADILPDNGTGFHDP